MIFGMNARLREAERILAELARRQEENERWLREWREECRRRKEEHDRQLAEMREEARRRQQEYERWKRECDEVHRRLEERWIQLSEKWVELSMRWREDWAQYREGWAKYWAEYMEDRAKSEQRFQRIEHKIATILRVLEQLPDEVCRRIGFHPPTPDAPPAP